MKYIKILIILLISYSAFAQNECPECDKFKIVGVYDFGPPPGGNWIILLLTINEDLDPGFDPHYTDLYFVASSGDTITKSIGPSHTLPQLERDTVPYMMELNTEMSNQNFPEDFNGTLVITTPTGSPCPPVTWCHVDYSKTITSAQIVRPQQHSFSVYPNPARDQIRIETTKKNCQVKIFDRDGKLLIGVRDYKSEELIGLSHMNEGLLLVQLIDRDNVVESQQILLVK